jgi:hypothetical protein
LFQHTGTPNTSNTNAGRLPAAPVQCPSQVPVQQQAASSMSDDTPAAAQIIPDEDPERTTVECDEGGDGGDGGGMGEDYDAEGDGDEDEDEDEPDPDAGMSTDSLRNPGRHTHPDWLTEAARAHLANFEKRDKVSGMPLLYVKDKTFWCQPQSPYLLLNGGSTSPTAIYDVRFFIWDPKSLVKELPCPYCRHNLHRHSAISRPRRCVDMQSTFYLIGFRYRCRHCKNPKTNKATVTFRSWDSRILTVLPPALAAEFPAKLTHRSGVSKALFSWMRTCFLNGMGAKRFADALLVQHLLRYDELHLQYLDFLVIRQMDQHMGVKYKSFLPFNDTSPLGFHGFVPSAAYLRDIYDDFMEEHRHEIDQMAAMTSGDICAIDHSHKVCLLIA